MAHQKFQYAHRVTYSECTLGNHVYYGRYLDIMEAARGELFRAAGLPLTVLQERNTLLPVVECQLRYRSPARYDDVLTVEVWLSALERVRAQFEYRFLREPESELLRASSLHACTSASDTLKRVPEEVRAALAPYVA